LVALNPPAAADGVSRLAIPDGTILNNLSIVTHLDCGLFSFLFTADVEQRAIQRLHESRPSLLVTVLKVPHHGARSSLDTDWIQSLHPDGAVVSVGRHNPYGHPATAVLEAYAQVPLLRTDEDGAVWFTGHLRSGLLQRHRARDFAPQPVRVQRGWWAAEYANLKNCFGPWLSWL
jgi:competence protein ComEC